MKVRYLKRITFIVPLIFFLGFTKKVLSNDNFLNFLNKVAEEIEKQNSGSSNPQNNFGNQLGGLNCDPNGNLKIIEDLCWDKYSSINAWKRRFPNCSIRDRSQGKYTLYPKNKSWTEPCIVNINNREIELGDMFFMKSSASSSGRILKELEMGYADSSTERSIVRYIKNNFAYSFSRTSDLGAKANSQTVYCSDFSCFTIWDDGYLRKISPSDYTLSIIDNYKIDSSLF